MQRKTQLWFGWTLGGLVAMFLLVDAVGKLLRLGPYVQGTLEFGYSDGLVAPLGAVLLVCTILYCVPRTAVLGAILLTGYLGGATATHVRVGQPYWFPILFGVLTWLALYLRQDRLRALLSLQSGEGT